MLLHHVSILKGTTKEQPQFIGEISWLRICPRLRPPRNPREPRQLPERARPRAATAWRVISLARLIWACLWMSGLAVFLPRLLCLPLFE
eukprot:COSAG03_NODE_323_length_8989_cov_6.562655_7_plen_89_part_00